MRINTMEKLKIGRYRRGDRRSSVRPHESFVIIMNANWCQRKYFSLFRGYKENRRQTMMFKEIISDRHYITREMRR